jgi:hypothetical protein
VISPEQLDVLRALQQHASAGEAERPGVVKNAAWVYAYVDCVNDVGSRQQSTAARSRRQVPPFAMDPRGVHTLPSQHQ